MSEELTSKYKKNGKIAGQKLGEFEYFQIGATTFKQLLKAKIIPDSFDNEYSKKKPDRLIVDRRGREAKVIAVIEDKDSGKFSSDIELKKAVEQCNNYCQEIGAQIGVITDGSTTVWINPQEKNKENEYKDDLINKKRSYTHIKKEDGIPLNNDFKIAATSDVTDQEKMDDDTKKTFKLINEIKDKIGKKNSIIRQPDKIDPLPLATRVWQDIWVATGKSPEKCLYNVVELFIFKFLSDLKLLTEPDSFEYLYSLIDKKTHKEIIDHYAKICRPKIRILFPKSPIDGTTIINGTIFVNEDGEANVSQAYLFVNSLRKFKDFEIEQGTFEYIDKDFKTKLFEAFLKQSEGQKALGQYFTPRKVVQAVVKMSGVENLSKGARFCDPFCGVGGFVLEPINLYRINDFEPKKGKIVPPISYLGFDKGFEKDDERTIILAKANMLLYLTEVISKNPSLSTAFAELFNNVFRLWKTNLGTLEHIFESEEERFDLILTNPPYVTSGSSSLKNEISDNTDLNSFYSVNAGGVEGLALEWIIKNLKKGGKAFIIIPDGILNRSNDKKMRKFILDSCFLDGIISLPVKTFFSTPKKTYILALTKKNNDEEKQSHPVFTYLVSNIGETLDVNRFDIPDNDLEEAVKLFRNFIVNKKDKDIIKDFDKYSRCKIQPLDKFVPEKHWLVDRWWSKDEKIVLGIEEEDQVINVSEFSNFISDTVLELNDLKEKLKVINSGIDQGVNYAEKVIEDVFNIPAIKGLTSSFMQKNGGDIPVYGGRKVEVPVGFIKDGLVGVKYFDNCLAWNREGSVGYVFWHKHKFSTNDHHRPIVVKDEYKDKIDLLYMKYTLQSLLLNQGFQWSKTASKEKVEKMVIKIPVCDDGIFDIEKQKEISSKYEMVEDIKKQIMDKLDLLSSYKISLD